MLDAIDDVLGRFGGACSRAELMKVISETQLDNEIRRGHLTRVFPRAYARPWMVDDADILDRAALACIGAPAAISHTSALRRWGLRADDGVVHVTITPGRRPRGTSGLAVHFTGARLPCVRDRGVLTAAPEAAVVQAWALSPDRRAHVIEVVRRRLATPAQVLECATLATRLPRRSELLELIDLLVAGCESELEIWGDLTVFAAPELRHGRQQLQVRVGSRRYRLDRAYEHEHVAVELDGDAYHSTREQRERDRRRDVALATVGWLTIRFSHRRLTSDPEGCRRELIAVLRTRRRAQSTQQMTAARSISGGSAW